jgi:hypothetical protein
VVGLMETDEGSQALVPLVLGTRLGQDLAVGAPDDAVLLEEAFVQEAGAEDAQAQLLGVALGGVDGPAEVNREVDRGADRGLFECDEGGREPGVAIQGHRRGVDRARHVQADPAAEFHG